MLEFGHGASYASPILIDETPKDLVNPVSLRNCMAFLGEVGGRLLDLSFVRVVIAPPADFTLPQEGAEMPLEMQLDRIRVQIPARFISAGDGWVRLDLVALVPSSRAHLRAFLSPKRVGESLSMDWKTASVRHYHGLNESELWVDENGVIAFTYLDLEDSQFQFLIRLLPEGRLTVGRLTRKAYMELLRIDGQLPLDPVSEKARTAQLGECRDILTNFRPTNQPEYLLKQRLLKATGDHLYSANYRVELAPRTL